MIDLKVVRLGLGVEVLVRDVVSLMWVTPVVAVRLHVVVVLGRVGGVVDGGRGVEPEGVPVLEEVLRVNLVQREFGVHAGARGEVVGGEVG